MGILSSVGKGPLRYLVAGGMMAVVVLGAVEANSSRLHMRLNDLEIACVAQALTRAAEEQVLHAALCDPTMLTWTQSSPEPYGGVRAEIVATQEAIWKNDSLLTPLAMTFTGLCFVPFLWRAIT